MASLLEAFLPVSLLHLPFLKKTQKTIIYLLLLQQEEQSTLSISWINSKQCRRVCIMSPSQTASGAVNHFYPLANALTCKTGQEVSKTGHILI